MRWTAEEEEEEAEAEAVGASARRCARPALSRRATALSRRRLTLA